MPTIQCPHCSAQLNIKDPALLGRTVRCPKCKQPFRAAEPAPAPAGFNSLDFEETQSTTSAAGAENWSEPVPAPNSMWSAPVREVIVENKKPELSQEEAARLRSRREFSMMVAGGVAGGVLAVVLLVFGGISVWKSMQRNAAEASANAPPEPTASTSAKLPTIFGFTEQRRALLVDYLVSQGQGRPKAKLRMTMIVNSLKKLATELDIEASEDFPEGLELVRERIVMRDIPDELLNGDKIPSDFRPLIDGYKNGTLGPEEEEVAILLLVAFLAAEM